MKTFYSGLLFLDEKLDLHQNPKLQQLDLFHATLPEWFRLPQQHDTSAVTFSLADRIIAKEQLDLLMNNLYQNAVRRDIYNRIIHSNSATPSPEAVDKIQILET